MKRIVASVGVVALGASGVQASDIQGAAPQKPWSISATLRGFYDDNINSVGVGGARQDSFGFEFSPGVGWNWRQENTTVTLGYTYSLLYFDHKPAGNTDHIDQDHNFDAALSHAFSDHYDVKVSDSFVIGQEPDTLRSGYAFSTFQRVSGDNIRNYGAINFDGQLTPLFGIQVGYANGFYDYQASGFGIDAGTGNVIASPAGDLNRLEHTFHLDGRFQVQPPTTAVVGYQFHAVDFTGGQPVAGPIPPQFGGPTPTYFSSSRNSTEHYGYVGLDQNFRPDLVGSARVGADYADYYNDPNQSSSISPYAQLSLRWTYSQESYLEAGFSYDRAATDLTAPGGDTSQGITLDSETAVVYGTWNHRITPRLFGNVVAQFQNSVYNGGAYNGDSERFYLLGLNLSYHFTPNFATELGYNYDKLDSQIPGGNRSFDRNRVYLGVIASY